MSTVDSELEDRRLPCFREPARESSFASTRTAAPRRPRWLAAPLSWSGACRTRPSARRPSATTRPSGPVPATALEVDPRASRAIRRASGDALTRPPFVQRTAARISVTCSLIPGGRAPALLTILFHAARAAGRALLLRVLADRLGRRPHRRRAFSATVRNVFALLSPMTAIVFPDLDLTRRDGGSSTAPPNASGLDFPV